MSYGIQPIDFPMYRRADTIGGDQKYHIIQLPKAVQTSPPQTVDATTGPPLSTPVPNVPDIAGLLDQSVFGIPVKYLALGAVAYFLFVRK